jgi:hypothetical protein
MDDSKKIITKMIWILVQEDNQIVSHLTNWLESIDSNKSNRWELNGKMRNKYHLIDKLIIRVQ